MRKNKLKAGQIYHICNKSIANFGIFKDPINALRFFKILDYYNNASINKSFSNYLQIKKGYEVDSLLYLKRGQIVKLLAYCIMPDHYHLLVKILVENTFSKYISNIENSFTRFFNIKFDRKGPLWQSRFRSVLIRTNEQLLHVSRYIHLNPTTSELIKDPEDWTFSSYNEYISDKKLAEDYFKEITIKNPHSYQKFVEDQKDYQIKLKKIKRLLLD